MNSKTNKHFFFVYIFLAVCLFPYTTEAFTGKIRSVYAGGPGGKSESAIWSVEKKDSEIIFYDNDHARVVLLKMDEVSKKPVELLFENAAASKIDSKARTLKKGKSGQESIIFVSAGHPVPYDWVDPFLKVSADIKVTTQSGSIKMSRILKKEVREITCAEASESGYLTEENSEKIDTSKTFTLFTLTDNGKLVLRQLWQDENFFWLYEETELRKSFLMGH